MNDDPADISQRLRRIEDREEIRTLVGRYALAMDDKNFDLVATLFAPDARFAWQDGSSAIEGCDNIVAMYRSRLGTMGPSYHFTHDQFVDWTGPDQASGLVLGHAELYAGGQQYVAAIRYQDRYVRLDGRWRFRERVLGFLYNVPADQYHAILGVADRIRLPGGNRAAHWPKL